MTSPPSNQLSEAMTALTAPPHRTNAAMGRGVTSDLSIDEVLLLHSASWEPAGVVFGVSWWSIPWGTWQWQVGEIQEAATAFEGAFAEASAKMRGETASMGGTGVVGVEVELRVHSQHVDIGLSGTAIRPTGKTDVTPGFLSDLSARDFVLLLRSGWIPLGLVAGASFVIAPRRSARQWASQQGRNTELAHLTQALYQAREAAMERMQAGGAGLHADGVVDVRLREGPLGHTSRVVQFMAVGTAVRVGPQGHQRITPTIAVALDEQIRQFEAASLRSSGTGGRSSGTGGRSSGTGGRSR